MDLPRQFTTRESIHRIPRVEDFRTLPALVSLFAERGWDLVERVLADQDSWDRYTAAQWRNIKTFLDARPDDELAPAFRDELDREPLAYTTYRREHLGWGVFALMRR